MSKNGQKQPFLGVQALFGPLQPASRSDACLIVPKTSTDVQKECLYSLEPTVECAKFSGEYQDIWQYVGSDLNSANQRTGILNPTNPRTGTFLPI